MRELLHLIGHARGEEESGGGGETQESEDRDGEGDGSREGSLLLSQSAIAPRSKESNTDPKRRNRTSDAVHAAQSRTKANEAMAMMRTGERLLVGIADVTRAEWKSERQRPKDQA